MTATDFAEYLSLMLTVPTVLLASLVVLNYWPRAKAALRHIRKHEQVTEVDLLVIGIAIGFTGAILDNVYWGIAWGAEFLGHPAKEFWFSNGVWANIPFRQTAGILAAIFHLWPVLKGRKKGNKYINGVAWATLLAGCVLVIQRLFFAG